LTARVLTAEPARLSPASHRRAAQAVAGWGWLGPLAWGIAMVVALPLMALFALAMRGSGPLWPHLAAHVLPQAAVETALLLAGVGVVVVAVGTGTAWLVTAYRFPGRRLFGWALALPLALPGYIAAYAYLDLLHPVGPAQTALRALLGIARPGDLILPDLRSLGGAVFLFGFVLYPYVYLTVRASFRMQSAEALEAARVLGASGWHSFFRVALPLARPAIAAGTGLALMEALGDVGAAEFLGVQTLTLSVYVTWATRGSVEGAAQIALAMLVPVAALLALERASRRGRARTDSAARPPLPRSLSGPAAWAASLACAVPVLLGFVAPAGYLVAAAWERIATHGVPPDLGWLAWNSARFAGVAAIAVIAAGFALAFCQRMTEAHAPMRLVQVGYAVPGTVLAVGLLGLLAAVDATISMLGLAALRVPLLLASSMALVVAYMARFLAVAANAMEAAYHRLPHVLDDAARAVGARAAALAWQIHWPLLRPATAAAFLLVFIECVKELPATLLLRPLNTETLATFVYGEAARGTYEEGAVAALVMVALGMLPVALLARAGR